MGVLLRERSLAVVVIDSVTICQGLWIEQLICDFRVGASLHLGWMFSVIGEC